ncbi:MD-2-related lipid-recognition protein-like [Fopius arisanus]|uniref:MD-2-related lipid-recognition protein-like n=1 Tax=Fopius arisanus TaxID=64838 RepID=A0A9R1T757_9HYME|nr:PREDICTED: MD-2-related lipid-recognition protein-like [Fopius arisanus]
MMRNFFLIFGAAFLTLTGAEVVLFQPCIYPENTQINCTVHELRINPCPEAAEEKPCRVKRGTNASIEFDYTTNFAADTLEGRAYWANQLIDLPFLGMSTNACASTPCPLKPDTKQTYKMTLEISEKYPAVSNKYLNKIT